VKTGLDNAQVWTLGNVQPHSCVERHSGNRREDIGLTVAGAISLHSYGAEVRMERAED
jgi:hypothetical protein